MKEQYYILKYDSKPTFRLWMDAEETCRTLEELDPNYYQEDDRRVGYEGVFTRTFKLTPEQSAFAALKIGRPELLRCRLFYVANTMIRANELVSKRNKMETNEHCNNTIA